ncbi:MAG TPA: ATP-binding protein [Polyangiaceae bacterium]
MEANFDSLLLEALPDVLVGTDADYRIRSWNAAAERTYGYSAFEVKGETADSVLDTQIPGGSPHECRTLLRARGQWHGEVSQRRKDGSRVLLFASASAVVAADGTVIGYVSLNRVANSERALDFLRRVAAAANGASDVGDALTSCVEEACAFLDFPVGHAYVVSEETGRLCSTNVWHLPIDRQVDGLRSRTAVSSVCFEDGALGLARILESKRTEWFTGAARSYGPEARFLPPFAPATAVAFPVLVGAEVTHILEFFHDEAREPNGALLGILEQAGTQLGRVVERVRAQRQRAYSEALERSNRELRLFAHVASHDLQEPLRMVTSFLELLRERYDDRLDVRGRGYVAHAVGGAQRMMALIRSLLEYSRLETRFAPPSPVSTDLALDEALDNLRQLVRERAVVVTRSPALPVVLADEAQLVQLFQNLIGNAVKFCEQDPPRVHVSARRAGAQFHFVVKDNGIGVDVKCAERVFEIFQRLHTKDEYPGTGVGLATCRRIVERHGGKIWLESEPQKGTEVHFALPGSVAGDP